MGHVFPYQSQNFRTWKRQLRLRADFGFAGVRCEIAKTRQTGHSWIDCSSGVARLSNVSKYIFRIQFCSTVPFIRRSHRNLGGSIQLRFTSHRVQVNSPHSCAKIFHPPPQLSQSSSPQVFANATQVLAAFFELTRRLKNDLRDALS